MSAKVILVGIILNDPAVVENQESFHAVFSMETIRKLSVPGNQPKIKKATHNIVAHGSWAKVVKDNCKRGTPVYLEGSLEYRIIAGQDKTPVQLTEIVVDDFEGKITGLPNSKINSSQPSAQNHFSRTPRQQQTDKRSSPRPQSGPSRNNTGSHGNNGKKSFSHQNLPDDFYENLSGLPS
ncbi:MAG: Single-stranded DNA-binding protein [Deltaproteobacteria bacterium ADurb.Bin135]|nr:MAG: Single-stranded DNA-binding protein [Deltaproteobacteria bacterium ADurb.Bin135]